MQRAQQLGRYHLLDRIAFGGMAEIFRAKTFDGEGRAHIVAVKRVLGHLLEEPDFLNMLIDEARIASLLVHGNVARVYEFSRAGGEYFMVMEYVDGKDLRTVLERCRQGGKPLPPAHAAHIVGEVALALHAAHSLEEGGRALHIVHRDVSPSNVIISYTGEVKLCDFGIAKATLSRVQTKTGVIKGKVKYMSPEQALGRKLDHRSDIFSLGAVLYELLTNQPPFLAPNEMDLLLKVRDAKYTPVREVEPEVHPALAAIVDRALMRSRNARYQTAADMSAALRGFLRDYVPGYGRPGLARFLRKMFGREIERELRLLEDYVVEEVDPDDVGENLIADALGPDAPFSRFTPLSGARSTTAQTTPGPAPRVRGDRQHLSSATTIPASDREGGPDIHNAETMILDRNRRRKPPKHPGSPGGRDPRELDPEIHDSPTQILSTKKRDR